MNVELEDGDTCLVIRSDRSVSVALPSCCLEAIVDDYVMFIVGVAIAMQDPDFVASMIEVCAENLDDFHKFASGSMH